MFLMFGSRITQPLENKGFAKRGQQVPCQSATVEESARSCVDVGQERGDRDARLAASSRRPDGESVGRITPLFRHRERGRDEASGNRILDAKRGAESGLFSGAEWRGLGRLPLLVVGCWVVASQIGQCGTGLPEIRPANSGQIPRRETAELA